MPKQNQGRELLHRSWDREHVLRGFGEAMERLARSAGLQDTTRKGRGNIEVERQLGILWLCEVETKTPSGQGNAFRNPSVLGVETSSFRRLECSLHKFTGVSCIVIATECLTKHRPIAGAVAAP